MNDELKYAIRIMTEADIPAFMDFYNSFEAADRGERLYSIADYGGIFESEQAAKYTPLLAIAEAESSGQSRLIGYGLSGQGDYDQQAWSYLYVLPSHRKHGVGANLYQRLEAAAIRLGISEMKVEADELATQAQSFLAGQGFSVDHGRWLMRLPENQAVSTAQIPAGYTIRNFVPGQDEANLRYVCDTSFTGFKDYFPSDTEHTLEETRNPGFDPASLLFACSGGEVVGYCLSHAESGAAFGWIYTLGVVADHRRSGVGRALLLTAIQYVRQFNPIVQLGVEDYNDKAIPLYQAVGFVKHRATAVMLKQLTESEARLCKLRLR